MNRRLVPWLLAFVAALAVMAGAQGPAQPWTPPVGGSGQPASIDGGAFAGTPASPLLQPDSDGGRAHVLSKLGVLGAAVAALALALSAALRTKRAAVLAAGRRRRAAIRGPPAPRYV